MQEIIFSWTNKVKYDKMKKKLKPVRHSCGLRRIEFNGHGG